MPALLIPRLKILAAAFLFSTGGMAVKSCTLTPWQVTCFRCALGAVAMLVLMPSARRRWTWPVVLVGCAYAGTMALYVFANKTTTSANAVFLISTAPLYILLLAPRLLGAGSGVFWAFTIMGLRWLERRGSREGAPVAVVAGNSIAALITLPFAFPVVSSQPTDWWWIFYLGFFQIAVAYVFLTTAMGAVPALEASLLILVEPVFTPLWSSWVHDEIPGPWAVTGGARIIAVTVIKTIWDAYRPIPIPET